MKRLGMIVMFALVAAPAWAMTAVKDESQFRLLVQGKDLVTRQMLVSITVRVHADGTITGGALGGDITGTWVWQDGYFCRQMDWGGRDIPYNCQLVEWDGSKLRFTTNRGDGDSADFRLR
ncbi:MAG: dihydrodipicolinate reductase [Pseudomonadota bacterium]